MHDDQIRIYLIYLDQLWQNRFDLAIAKLKTDHPMYSLIIYKIYAKARTNAILKSNLKGDRFPTSCPYQIEDLID